MVSPCLAPSFKGEWEHAEITYRLSGQKTGTVWLYSSFWGRRVNDAACPCQGPLRSRETVITLPLQTSLYLSLKWRCPLNLIRTLGGPCQRTVIHQLLEVSAQGFLVCCQVLCSKGPGSPTSPSEKGLSIPRTVSKPVSEQRERWLLPFLLQDGRFAQAAGSPKACDRAWAAWPLSPDMVLAALCTAVSSKGRIEMLFPGWTCDPEACLPLVTELCLLF